MVKYTLDDVAHAEPLPVGVVEDNFGCATVARFVDEETAERFVRCVNEHDALETRLRVERDIDARVRDALVRALEQAESTLLMARAELPAETLGQKRDREQIDRTVIQARTTLSLAKESKS